MQRGIIVRREHREVRAGGASHQRDACGIGVVLRGVIANPREHRVHVVELRRPVCGRRVPVVDSEDDIAARREPSREIGERRRRPALPGAAVDLHEERV